MGRQKRGFVTMTLSSHVPEESPSEGPSEASLMGQAMAAVALTTGSRQSMEALVCQFFCSPPLNLLLPIKDVKIRCVIGFPLCLVVSVV